MTGRKILGQCEPVLPSPPPLPQFSLCLLAFFGFRTVPVFRIRDILVRIRIRGSPYVWLTDPTPDPGLFVSDLQDTYSKNFFRVFLLITFGRYRYQHFQHSHNSRSQGFFTLLLNDGRIRIIPLTNGSGSGRTKTYGSGSGPGTLVDTLPHTHCVVESIDLHLYLQRGA